MRPVFLLVAVLFSMACASSPPPAPEVRSGSPPAQPDASEPAARPSGMAAVLAAADKPYSPPLVPVNHAALTGRFPSTMTARPELAGCEAGRLRECLAAGLWLRGQPTAEHTLARALWQGGCGAGDAADCYRASLLADVHTTLDLSAKACLGDVFEACYLLGLLTTPMSDGQQVSSKLFARSCAGGVPEGCLELARKSEDRRPGVTDHERALGFYARACELGERLGCEGVRRIECQLGRRSGEACAVPPSGTPGGELGGQVVLPPPPPPPTTK